MKRTCNFLLTSFLSAGLILGTSSCYFASRLGPEVDEERNVGDFNELEVTSGIDVKLSQGSRQRVIIKASEDIIDDVETKVVNGRLKVSLDRRWWAARGSVDAEITYVDLRSIDLSAGSDLQSEGLLTFDDLELQASAGSDLRMELEARSVDMRVSSGSDAKLSGSARRFIARASSGSDIDAYDFETEDASIECSSGSDVKIYVTGTLNVKASSGSDVHYRGNPSLMDINTSSGADLIRRD